MSEEVVAAYAVLLEISALKIVGHCLGWDSFDANMRGLSIEMLALRGPANPFIMLRTAEARNDYNRGREMFSESVQLA